MSRALANRPMDTHADRVLEAILYAPDGMTDFELSSKLHILLSSINAARNTLMAKGLVEWRGDRRPSGRGGMAKVWQIAAGA
ncbi:MarR family transcriptional regulator [Streptomyces sp. NRRL F-5123]|uniref:MarR family transcriptional regulator n=1 Tax=Streptomyces sp. NRRL F-5123 TaxID=1463856 RepID=UPI0004E0EDF4|nr:MarR family transcriptional regulator [Streptomyces sp. NRRL F-5123]